MGGVRKWDTHTAAPRFQEALAKAQAERYPPRFKANCEVQGGPREVQPEALATQAPYRIRTLVLYGGGGGVRVGLEALPDFDVVGTAEHWEPAAAIYEANFVESEVDRVDLSVDGAVAGLVRKHKPVFVQYSPPCPDFSRRGKRQEGHRAELLVTSTQALVQARVPVLLMENVVGVLGAKCDAWRRSSAVLTAGGYNFVAARVNAQDCGTPQHRPRVWVLAVLGGSESVLNKFVRLVEGIPDLSLGRTVAEAVPGVKDTFYFRQCNGRAPCVLPSSGVSPCVLTAWDRGGPPPHYRRREGDGRRGGGDAGPVSEASCLTFAQKGAVMGFPLDYEWLEGACEPKDIARVQGNAVAPQMMTEVARCALAAGVFAFADGFPMRSLPDPGVFRVEELTATVRVGRSTQPSWHVLGGRGDGTPLMADQALRARVRRRLRSKPFSGTPVRVAGRPQQCWRAYAASDAPREQLAWVRDHGFRLKFNAEVPRMDTCQNNPGCEEYATWLYAMVEELLYLGILTEVPEAPWVVCPLNVVVKGGYDAVLAPWRLRCILDQRKLNEYLDAPPFRMETLHQARYLFESDDVMLLFDLSAAFYHLQAHPDSRKFMGCTLGGRFFVWNVCPMGTTTSPYAFQTLVWVLVRRWRKILGLRLVAYQDDFGVLCKRWQVKALAAFLLHEFAAHGLLVNVKKTDVTGLEIAVLLGIEIDLPEMMFRVPDAKKVKICGGIDELLEQWRVGEQVYVRLLAKTCGRIMATLVAVGLAARRMTRDMYAYICGVLDIPVDATRRQLRVAWDVRAPLSDRVVGELLFWRETLPGHAGMPIRPREIVPRVIVASDASDRAWMGWLDFGSGCRLLARDVLDELAVLYSSTARELIGLLGTLVSFATQIGAALAWRGGDLVVYCDNQGACRALDIGSKTPEVHQVAAAIFRLAMRNGWSLTPRWLSRDTSAIRMTDDGSKLGKVLDLCDFKLDPAVFTAIEGRWGVTHTVDRFASDVNRQGNLPFNSFVYAPGASDPDAFTVQWGGADNWIFPPFSRVGQAVRHLQICRAKGTIIVPNLPNAVWWPLVRAGAPGSVFRGGKPLRLPDKQSPGLLKRRLGLLLAEGARQLPKGRFDLLAIRLDFSSSTRGMGHSLIKRVKSHSRYL